MSRLANVCETMRDLLLRVETAIRSALEIDFRHEKRSDIDSVISIVTSVSVVELTEEQRAYIQEMAESVVDRLMEEMRARGTIQRRTQGSRP